MAPRETEDNAYAKFWGDKQRVLWYVMVFSGVVNCIDPPTWPPFDVVANQELVHLYITVVALVYEHDF